MATHFLRTATAPALVFLSAWMGTAAAESMTFHTRARASAATGSDRIEVIEKQVQWDPARTAVVVCDMWDKHHCPDATERVAEMAPRMNEVLKAARAKGMLIIHCPSDTMEFYKDHPGRKLAQAAPKAATRAPLEGWRAIDGSKEPPLPIDDSDGGCDGSPDSPSYKAWTRQHPALEIMDGDAITDSAEAFYLMRQRGITNVVIMGVHINMCVLGRPFAIRQMVTQGQNVLLMRDMTDSMYNHRKRPWVSHFRGTELVVEHIEQYWCPSIASVDFLAGAPFRFKGHVIRKIALIIGENEYSTWETLPAFARKELEWRGYQVSTVLAPHKETDPNFNTFANFEAIRGADLIVVSARRRTPQKAMMDLLRAHVAEGKPVVGVRTANHAFQAGPPSADFAAWNDFDTAVLGGHYAGHYNNKPPAAPHSLIEVVESNAAHPVLSGVKTAAFRVTSHLYKCRGLASTAVPLLQGRVEGQNAVEPVAWVQETDGRRVFYTSLGNTDDFKLPVFRRMLLNGILWSLKHPVPPAEFDMAAAGTIAPSPPAAAPAPEASPKAENRSE